MTLQVFGGAALLVAGSALVGDALRLIGIRSRAAAPAVGLALLIVLASVAIKLPGRGVTAAVALVLAIAIAAVTVCAKSWREARVLGRDLLVPAVSGLVVALSAAVPFLANGHVGLPGVSFDNDTASHLLWAQMLRSPAVAARYGGLPAGYPLGPHSLVDALSGTLGLRLDLGFTALSIAVLVIMALVASAALRGESAWKRVVVAVLGAIVYLVAAYYGQGAFKEVLLAALLLAFALQLEEVRAEWAPRAGVSISVLVPLAVLVAGAVYSYSYPAVAWMGLTLLLWLGAEAGYRRGWRRLHKWEIRRLLGPVAAIAGVLVVLLAADAGRILSFVNSIGISPAGTGAITTSNLGNLAYPLSAWEALGIWNSSDFRVLPANLFHADALGAFALAVLLIGMGIVIARRDFVLPAAVAACALIYWVSSRSQSPYVTAKALVIAGPVVVVAGLGGLLRAPRDPSPGWMRGVRLAMAGGFVILAAHSSYLALRNEPVWPPESTSELLSLDEVTRGQTVLFLGNTDYAAWLFSDSKMSALASNSISMDQASSRASKPFVFGAALDFDTVDPASLNRFRWVVTSNTTAASAPPVGFVLARRLRMYELWERVATVEPRSVIEAPGAPGAVLDCRNRLARAFSRRAGAAAVMTAPITASIPQLTPGSSATLSLRLPRGAWDLSLQYVSELPLSVSAAGKRWSMPAYLDRPGPFFSIGRVSSPGGTVRVTMTAGRPSLLTGHHLIALASEMAAVRAPDARTLVPLSRACGRYVDWYRLSSN